MEPVPCLMTRLPAAPEMTERVGAMRPDVPTEAAVNAVPRTLDLAGVTGAAT